MDVVPFVSIAVALIAMASGYAAQRTAARASTRNVDVTSRVDMEKEAYMRARALDIETIQRQDADLDELRAKTKEQDIQIKALIDNNDKLRKDLRTCNNRVSRLEHGRVYDPMEGTDNDE